ncbi:4-hydroxythreonine-4-phosphate dehydrogenase PdxA [Tellurirhabdus rosea]|uniref:4-hydroxythreonine-4-phosphate dehydrogenase PdxA n=1 Tax=Tellurirhabdus rosea TaxID=2674997 RepID=UPI00225294AC|nr:4-hydroxythreonine-4-phosphate dehydrogenase PdxA [Tellurirhabdus rosea]
MEQRQSERKNERQLDNGQEWGGSEKNGQDRQGQDRQNANRNNPERINPEDRLVIGITLGDYNGVGPEVILKALQNNRLQKICTPVIYGSMRVLNRYKNILHQAGLPIKDWNLNGIQQVSGANHRLTNVITCWNEQNQNGQNSDIQPGKVTPEAGAAALACLQRATEDLKAGHLHAVVTAPINKHNIQNEEFKFPGHTEYFAAQFENRENLMFLVSPQLRVGVVTGHIPLGRVRSSITRERVLQKLNLMYASLRNDFGIRKPRIAVLGLNPHAGENGLLGNEEQEILIPLINELRQKGQLIYGPFPSDGFFGTQGYRKYDAVLAMYHDQGLIPFKTLAFDEGVNFTAGLPIVRTSPDHGTAYDIAGKNLADENSMLQAIFLACDIARTRKEAAELETNALKKTIGQEALKGERN